MVEELSKGMDGPVAVDIKKGPLITVLIFAFGFAMLFCGFFVGELVEYKKQEANIRWYENHCICSMNQDLISNPMDFNLTLGEQI